MRRARGGYYGLITYFDEKIGRLLQALEETGQRDNTVIVHFSDHGEMNGEHGMWRKSSFYEASARVPLQLVWPGRLAPARHLAPIVPIVDLVATLLDVAGPAAPAPLDDHALLDLSGGRRPDCDGTSTLAQLTR